MTRFGLNRLGSDPQLPRRFSDTSFNQEIRAEALADFADIHRNTLELERRGSRKSRSAMVGRLGVRGGGHPNGTAVGF